MLSDGTIDTFKRTSFEPALPALLPRRHFLGTIPATARWFLQNNPDTWELNYDYLSQFGDTIVPLELTKISPEAENEDTFIREDGPLDILLNYEKRNTQGISLYLAQASRSRLPLGLQRDLPTPSIVLRAGKGDIYDTNLWIGKAPTYTPLHRDPNPNLFVQLAGRKEVRLYAPEVGKQIFDDVMGSLDRAGAGGTIRGEEMMMGKERREFEKAVWHGGGEGCEVGYEVSLEAGDGLFIPKGWWHSIKGVGEGITASVNWWFR